MPSPKSLFWFRRDLRLEDNVGLSAALTELGDVLPVFIFDRNILDDLDDRPDPRLTFIHQEVEAIKKQLEAWGCTLRVYYDKPEQVYKQIKEEFPDLEAVFTNKDYEPYARKRDEAVRKLLEKQGIDFYPYKDHVILEETEVLSQGGTPFSVYTPYAKKWHAIFHRDMLDEHPVARHKGRFWQTGKHWALPSLKEMGFTRNDFDFPDRKLDPVVLKNYARVRDLPGKDGTSRLGMHLRFGTISIRQAFKAGLEHSSLWVRELIWREFYSQLLANNPQVEKQSFKPQFDHIKWRNNEDEFKAWCEGRTGYPLVDAGMRQLNTEHWMHNRVRMVVASFLCKHLLIDWRWGEAYFHSKLLDYELASNNGGWQWAAGTGADAAPYFRVFNPELQLQKFDPQLEYVRRYVPEYGTGEYPQPMVDHKMARERALEGYKRALKL